MSIPRRYNKILFVRLAYYGFLGNVDIFPVGLGYLAESMRERGFEYEVLDLGLFRPEQEEELLRAKLKEYSPDLLAITMMTLGYKHHYALLDRIKGGFQDIDIVLGGAHLSTMRLDVLNECIGIDYGAVMDGEHTLAELCEGVELSQIKGLIYRQASKAVFNGERTFVTELDSIPFPKYDLFPLGDYTKEIPLFTSRGCPYLCTFCPVASAVGRHFRIRSPEHIIEEVGYWYDKGARSFSIWDDNFTMKPERVYRFCELLKEKVYTDIRFSVPNGVRADKVNAELLKTLWGAGFRQLSFGVESGVDHVLSSIKKGESIEVIENSVKLACDLGYEVYLYFIVGLPGETWQDFKQSLAMAARYPVAESRFYNLVPFPATELFAWADRNNFFITDPEEFLNRASHFENEPYVETPEMSAEERKRGFDLAMELTIKQRKAWRVKQFSRYGKLGTFMAIVSLSSFYSKMFKPVWMRRLVIEPVKGLFFGAAR